VQGEIKEKEEIAYFKVLKEFNEANNAQWEVAIDKFVPQLQETAAAIGKRLKPE
jgi:hypothetical protein